MRHLALAVLLPSAAGFASGSPKQHLFIVRHGDKYSSYDDCKPGSIVACYNKTLLGDNPPLTPCGLSQAAQTARWLKAEAAKVGGINSIAVSPFARTMMTSEPLAAALGLPLSVEYHLSEAMQLEGPFQPHNSELRGTSYIPEAVPKALEDAIGRWDLNYGSPPIQTPESRELYLSRVEQTVQVLKQRFPISSGNHAFYTHATPVLSLAYGLCHAGDSTAESRRAFVANQDAVGPAGVIHIIRDEAGGCTIGQTQNVASAACGPTEPYKCDYDKCPSWYWPPLGAKCECS